MPKILLELQTPSNGKKYEIVADDRITAAELAKQISQELAVHDSTAKIEPDNIVLADKNTNTILKDNLSLSSQQVKGGHTLIMI